MAKHIFKYEGTPIDNNVTPKQVGHHYIDTLNRKHYISVDTDSPTDWILQQSAIGTINGLSAEDIILDIDDQGTEPNITDDGINTITINIPKAEDSGVTAGTISNDNYESFSNRVLNVQNVLYVVKNTGDLPAQHFNSINDALDSISTNSATNPFLISVGPGIFIEDTIQCKSYVWIQGAEQDQTIIEVDDTDKHVVIGADNSGISKCVLRGATDSGFAGVYYASTTGTTNTSFFVEDCRFGNNDTLAIADATDASTAIFVENCKFGSIYQFNHGFLAQAGGRIVVRNSTTTGLSAPYPDYVFKATGSGSQLVLNGLQLRSGGLTTGAGILLSDGALLRALSVNIRMFGKALHIENVGDPSVVDAVGVLLEGNTIDIQVDHPDADGTFNGSADHNKIVIEPSCGFSTIISCNSLPNDGTGQVVVGTILQGDRFDRLANLSKIARTATTLGVDEVVEDDFIEVVSGLTIRVNPGTGFLNDPVDLFLKEVFWDETDIVLSANSTYFIYVDTDSQVIASLTLPSLQTVVVLGRVNTNATGIRFIENSDLPLNHYGNKTEAFFRNVLGPVFQSGGIVTESGSNARRLNITAANYSYGVSPFPLTGGSEIVWEQFYRNGSGGFTSVASQNTLSNSQYDNNSGTLTNLTAGYYTKHHLYVLGGDTADRYFIVHGQAQYATFAEALDGSLPIIPSFMNLAVTRVAGIIVKQGTTNIVQVQDIRPRIGFSAPSGTAVTDHGDLTGLTDDDHLQYLPVNGARAMTGPLDMGSQAITNVGNVDGVDVSAHASRHLPNGADPLTTAAPAANLTATTTNSTGTANSMARSDHSHAITTGAASTQTPDQSNAAGSSASLARADHVHQIQTAAASSLTTSSTNTQGSASSFSRSDHTHSVSVINSIATVAGDTTTTSGTDVLMNGMTLTPSAGTYLALFSTTLESNSSGSQIDISVYSGGSAVTGSGRWTVPQFAAGGLGGNPSIPIPITTMATVTVNGSQAVEIRWRRGAGTATAGSRSLILIKLSN